MKLFVKNQSNNERIIRLIIGLAFTASLAYELSNLTIIIAITGGTLIFNAVSGNCYIYRILGYSTCPVD